MCRSKRLIRLRKDYYQDELNRYYKFLINNFQIQMKHRLFSTNTMWAIKILNEGANNELFSSRDEGAGTK